MKITSFLTSLCLTCVIATAHAHDTTHNVRPDDHAPIGVMGDHLHKAGEWMTSYRYSRMEMTDNYDGDNTLSAAQVRAQGFNMAPIDMTMEMHMLGAMYGLTNDITLTAMGSYIEKEMHMENGANAISRMESNGMGDTTIGALYRLSHTTNHQWHLNAGLSLPTGSIEETAADGQRLPYGMQLGSGTFDLNPGITYRGHTGDWSWGSQALAVIRLGKNDNDYALGDELKFTAWGARQLDDALSVSLRLAGHSWGNVSGADPAFSGRQGMSPVFRSDLRAGSRVDAAIGVNLVVPSGTLKGHRLNAEYSIPAYQNLEGAQLGMDQRLMIGWQKAF